MEIFEWPFHKPFPDIWVHTCLRELRIVARFVGMAKNWRLKTLAPKYGQTNHTCKYLLYHRVRSDLKIPKNCIYQQRMEKIIGLETRIVDHKLSQIERRSPFPPLRPERKQELANCIQCRPSDPISCCQGSRTLVEPSKLQALNSGCPVISYVTMKEAISTNLQTSTVEALWSCILLLRESSLTTWRTVSTVIQWSPCGLLRYCELLSFK